MRKALTPEPGRIAKSRAAFRIVQQQPQQ